MTSGLMAAQLAAARVSGLVCRREPAQSRGASEQESQRRVDGELTRPRVDRRGVKSLRLSSGRLENCLGEGQGAVRTSGPRTRVSSHYGSVAMPYEHMYFEIQADDPSRAIDFYSKIFWVDIRESGRTSCAVLAN